MVNTASHVALMGFPGRDCYTAAKGGVAAMTITLAREGPDTGRDHFFICIGDQPELDFGGRRNPDGQGFAAFGRVIEGMSVVRRLQASPAEGQDLEPAIGIQRAIRLR